MYTRVRCWRGDAGHFAHPRSGNLGFLSCSNGTISMQIAETAQARTDADVAARHGYVRHRLCQRNLRPVA